MRMRTHTITAQPTRGAEAVFALVRAATRRQQSRRERAVAAVREHANPRLVLIAGAGLVAAGGLAYAGRRLMRRRNGDRPITD